MRTGSQPAADPSGESGLIPLADRYELNVVTASGEISAIACRELVERAVQDGRPVRVLYISDFDPAGRSMPVAMARKVEHEIDRRQVELDIQVRPIVLTEKQCRRYTLPRTPIKETERRGAKFEERFGEGPTELDALEAIHPGELRRILEREIHRYWNPDHDSEVDDAIDAIHAQLADINDAVKDEFRDELAELDGKFDRLRWVFKNLEEDAHVLFAKMRARLEEQELNFEVPAIEFEADEDEDPLFDSRRGYLEQLAAYKRFQGKM